MAKSSFSTAAVFLGMFMGAVAAVPQVTTGIQACTAISDAVVATNLDPQGWDYGVAADTRANGHIEYISGGLHVYTDGTTTLDKAAGYKAVNVNLQDIGVPDIQYSLFTGGRAGLQLVAYVDGAYRGIIVGEPWAYGDGNYWSKANFGIAGQYGYTSFGTLNDYLAANPNTVIKAIGFSLGSGVKGDDSLKSITAGCVKYTWDKIVPTVKPCTAVTDAPVSTNLDQQGWDYTIDTRPSGHVEYTFGGLHVYTEGATTLDKATGYKVINVQLKDIGVPDIQIPTFTAGRAGLQLVAYQGTVYKGILVGEPWAYGAGNYWSNGNFGISPGAGYPSFGTLNDYLAANPDLTIQSIGFSLGSGLYGDDYLTSITAGCKKYTWDKIVACIPTPPAGATCGLRSTSVSGIDPNVIGASFVTYAQCQKNCLANPSCQAIVFDHNPAGSQFGGQTVNCGLLSPAAQAKTFFNGIVTGTYEYDDRACLPVCPPVVSTSSTAGTSTASVAGTSTTSGAGSTTTSATGSATTSATGSTTTSAAGSSTTAAGLSTGVSISGTGHPGSSTTGGAASNSGIFTNSTTTLGATRTSVASGGLSTTAGGVSASVSVIYSNTTTTRSPSVSTVPSFSQVLSSTTRAFTSVSVVVTVTVPRAGTTTSTPPAPSTTSVVPVPVVPSTTSAIVVPSVTVVPSVAPSVAPSVVPSIATTTAAAPPTVTTTPPLVVPNVAGSVGMNFKLTMAVLGLSVVGLFL